MVSVRWVDSAESTNTILRDGPCEHGDSVATFNQTNGRGRLGREWIDVPGKGLAISVAVCVPVAVPTLVPLVAGAAAIESIRALTGRTDLWLKWPNDVYLGDSKVAGILTEMPSAGRIIVGLGLNINHRTDELPVSTATSLAIEGIEIDPVAFAEGWSELLCLRSAEIGSNALTAWINGFIGLKGELVRIDFPDGTHRTGTLAGIAADGSLVLGTGDPIVAGDISRLRPAE
ncbi:MAG: hypothetical protein RLZZ587_508 [Actinomycetota bacterium]